LKCIAETTTISETLKMSKCTGPYVLANKIHPDMFHPPGHSDSDGDELDPILQMFNMNCIKNPLARSLHNGHELNAEEYQKVDGYMKTLLDDITKSTNQTEVKHAAAKFHSKMPPCSKSGCLKVGILQCSKCKVAKYCGKDCQKSHWNESHNKQCKNLKSDHKV
jgi:hypothetical protein